MKDLHIAALGSSFASGPGIAPQVDRNAMRSGNNYANILATRLGARLTDLTVSGATLENVLSEPQVFFGARFEPQLTLLPPYVDVVTITGGGNDLNYIGSAISNIMKASYLGRLSSYLLPTPNQNEPLTVEGLSRRFIAVIDKVRETSPNCRILLVEYLTIFGPHIRPGIDVSFDSSQIQELQAIAKTLQKAYTLAAGARPGCKSIPVAEYSLDHGLGSEEPWVDGFNLSVLLARKTPFHPNIKGMQAVADLLYKELKGALN